jgi:hypothetical protein
MPSDTACETSVGATKFDRVSKSDGVGRRSEPVK